MTVIGRVSCVVRGQGGSRRNPRPRSEAGPPPPGTHPPGKGDGDGEGRDRDRMMLLWVLWRLDAPEHLRVLAACLRGAPALSEQEYTLEILEDLQADGLVRHVPDHPALPRQEALLRNVRHARPMNLDYAPTPAFYTLTGIGCEYPPFLRFREEVLLMRQAEQETLPVPATRTSQVAISNPLARMGWGPRELEVPIWSYLAITTVVLLLAVLIVVAGAELLTLPDARTGCVPDACPQSTPRAPDGPWRPL